MENENRDQCKALSMKYSLMFKKYALFTGIAWLIMAHAVASGWNADSLALAIPARVTGSPEEFATYLNEHFSSETDRIKALFSWMTFNISYDLGQVEILSRFENLDEFVTYTLKNKKAVCQGYAEVFTAVCGQMGIKALTIHGYNKVDGRLKTDLGHAWNVAWIDGKWRLFDPTWGSGYLDNGRYTKSFDAYYFMTSPDSLIRSHMPFDPVWQLREYPSTHDQFIEGGSRGSVYYNFTDSLNLYYSLDEVGRAESTLRRAEATHANRKEILKMYRNFSDYVTNIKCNLEITRFNESSVLLIDAIDRFNEYQELKRRRSPDKVRQKGLLVAARSLTQQSLIKAQTISPCPSLSIQEIQRLIRQIREVNNVVTESLKNL